MFLLRKVSRGSCQIKEYLKWNPFSEKFLYRWYIKNFLNKLHVTKVVELTAAKKELILVLPYLGQQLFGIRNRTQSWIKKNSSVFTLRVIFQSRIRLSTLFTFKDKNNKILHSNLLVIFSIRAITQVLMILKPFDIAWWQIFE